MSEPELRWIQLTFVDVFGTINSMMLPASRLEDAFDKGVVFDGSALEGQARHFESNMRLWPDRETLRDLGNGFGRAVCDVRTPAGAAWPGDPRTALHLVVDHAESLGRELTISTELEFYLLDENGEPIDQAGYFDGVTGAGPDVVTFAGDLLRARGVEVSSAHHEAGPGQYELDLAPLPPLAQADAIMLAKETLRHAAYRSHVRVTFMPLPFAERPGSGLHLHQRARAAQARRTTHRDRSRLHRWSARACRGPVCARRTNRQLLPSFARRPGSA